MKKSADVPSGRYPIPIIVNSIEYYGKINSGYWGKIVKNRQNAVLKTNSFPRLH